jgi:nucleotide-binding universal stress UspA family protein
VLAPLQAEYAQVETLVRIQHAPRADAVLDAAGAADLLVLGRRHHLLPLGSHLGPVARAALDRASCPVLVVPEPGAAVAQEDQAAAPEGARHPTRAV